LPYEAITEEEYNKRTSEMKPFIPSLISKYELEEIDIDQIIAHSEDNEELANHLLELVRKQADMVEPERKNITKKTK
jgi:hypothetical protein